MSSYLLDTTLGSSPTPGLSGTFTWDYLRVALIQEQLRQLHRARLCVGLQQNRFCSKRRLLVATRFFHRYVRPSSVVACTKHCRV